MSTLNCLLTVRSLGVRAVESHISRKTSEMWGTRRSLLGNDRDLLH